MIRIIWFIFSLSFSASAFSADDVELVFPSAVEVSPREELTMYDVVEARNITEEIVSELKDINIKNSQKNSFSKNELVKMLRTIKARFVLPMELKIIRSKSSISRMEVERKIKNKIYASCAQCDIKIQISSVPGKMESDWQLDLNIDLTKNTLMIPIYSAKNSDLRGWVVADVKRYHNVPVVAKPIKIGDVLTEDMFVIEKRQLTNARDTVQKTESLIGMQASRFINLGQIIHYSDLKKEQVLKKGQMVRAVIGGTDFEVIISAESQESGAIGETVKVKNLDSLKVFAAKIVDRGLVRIE